MLINRTGASYEIDGKKYTIGMAICATDESDYEGLYGRIIEIADGEDKQTENETVDIVCEFYVPQNSSQQAELEERFSALYAYPKTVDDIALDYVIMAPDMIRAVKRCRIYQIDPPDNEFIFRSFNNVADKGLSSPPAELYRVVFDGQLETDDLEDIFRIFNIEHPEGYMGRSLSVSDIVELYDDTNKSFHYCEIMGFKEISFVPASNTTP